MVYDDIAEELAHQDFIDECNKLVEQIRWKASLIESSYPLKVLWDDIAVYGDEPVFASLLMDKLIEEAEK